MARFSTFGKDATDGFTSSTGQSVLRDSKSVGRPEGGGEDISCCAARKTTWLQIASCKLSELHKGQRLIGKKRSFHKVFIVVVAFNLPGNRCDKVEGGGFTNLDYLFHLPTGESLASFRLE